MPTISLQKDGSPLTVLQSHPGTMACALFLLILPNALAMCATLGFTLGIGPQAWLFWSAIAASIGATAYWATSDSKRHWYGLAAGAAITAVALLISKNFIDVWWDARAYHKPAILFMLEGWNPILAPQAQMVRDQLFQILTFPKGSWYASALTTAAVGGIESGKFLNVVLMTACLLTSWVALGKFGLKGIVRTLCSVALMANPMAAMQWQTSYQDGMGASLLTTLTLSLATYNTTRDRRFLALAVTSLSFAANLKFTFLAFGGILYLMLLAGPASDKRERPALLKATLLLAFLVLSLGFNPYITNTIHYGSPLHPLLRIDEAGVHMAGSYVTAPTMPSSFIGVDRVTRFIKTIFSMSAWTFQPLSTGWHNGWRSFLHYPPNLQVVFGGFGPLFWCPFVIGGLLLPLVRHRGLWIAFAAVLVTLFIHDSAWFSRYMPQIWLLPCIPMVGAATRNRAGAIAAVICALLLLLNTSLVVKNMLPYDLQRMRDVRSIIIAIKQTGHNELTPDLMDMLMPSILQRNIENPIFHEPCEDGNNACRVRDNMVFMESRRFNEYGITTTSEGQAAPETLEAIKQLRKD